ncbi:hypothetical protein NCCP2716_20530 [Sporosarcina sp. NCCP-2716]|uniref:sensor domain-containing diguanylate cyclase n=1 Tax=Sporosarcina sp. NCCP-2716 TaxID=2943679 RepID=UPI00203F6011|nr:GGDEF domain-containing protein [Sporosarcina sp. NCCP-2716]GKV69555.1 hypothetical protein NCCP2716_20530 [Sporosarcina sp. NCCP-2716]
MQTNEQLFSSLKGDLLDLLIDVLKDHRHTDGIHGLETLFSKYFGIAKFEFFLYTDNQFHLSSACEEGKAARRVTEIDLLAAPVFQSDPDSFDETGDFADDTVMLRNTKREPVAMILLKSTDAWDAFSMSSNFRQLQQLLGEMVDIIMAGRASEKQAGNYLDLLQATKQFNSTMKMHVIYDQLVETVASNLAPFDVELIVSHEEHSNSSRYRLFDYANEQDATIDAFLSGELRVSRDLKRGAAWLTAPVKGMQGTYGVLQITAPVDSSFSDAQQGFVRSICESAGHAIENSSLYSQSHRLIRDLQLVNEVSKKLTGRLTFLEMKTYLAERLKAAFEPEEIAFVYFDKQKSPILLDTTTDYFLTDAGKRYMEYAENRLRKEQDALFAADLAPEEIDGFSPYRSMIIAPITISDSLSGYTMLLHTDKYYFSFDDFKLVKAIISHSSLALSNLMLRDKLQELANKDQLTGLFARGYLDRHMSQSFREGIGGAFILLDVDDFKQVNDQYGHTVGDQVLIQAARVLQAAAAGGDIAGRWGGEEFAVFLPGAGLERGKELAQRLLDEMPAATDPSVTISVGMSIWAPSASRETYQQLFQATDDALYKAKAGGKNRMVISESILAK